MSSDAQAAREHQRRIDELWDFDDPAGSELRFTAAAGAAAGIERDVLMTQVARALGLQERFDDALAVLDALPAEAPETQVRALIERGRVLNTRGASADARPFFEDAFEAASSAGLEFLAIDALHMVAIVAEPADQDTLNSRALELASSATDPRARQWRASLLNNLGWARFEAGEHEAALDLFREALAERESHGKDRETGIARWCVARALRELGRVDEALAEQVSLREWLSERGITDPYVDEEIAECRRALEPGSDQQ